MLPGKRIGHYTLIEQIGQGGQAAVWSAEDQQLKRTVAVKTINLSGESSEMGTAQEQMARFENEARTIADLEHPYILPIYTYGEVDGWLYIIMRYMAGGTLSKLIKAEPLDVSHTLRLARPLADALDLAHTRQIVHRDIKSVNILLDAQNRPYLSDFGLSVTAGDSSSQSGSGTLAYMSPEQLRGDPSDFRSDLYSFGMLVYEILVGATPAINGQHWNLLQVMSATPLPMPATIAPAVADVLRRGMALAPLDRYESATSLVEALAATQSTNPHTTVLSLDDDDDDFFTLLPSNDPALLALNRANTLFDTALSEWADGAGRFRLYADDFNYIDSFYSDSGSWDLALSDAGKRLMLRAALEHGYKLDTWWAAVGTIADRRALALQTLNSELPPARLRAIEYLTVIDDSTPSAIPIRVASILSAESDSDVRQAGVILLEERASKLATGPANGWRPVIYSDFIDDVLAELAGHDLDPRVAEVAARAVGRLRSAHAVAKLVEWAQAGDDRALQVLVYIRDEAPSLPDGVPAALRRQVFVRVTSLQWWSRQLAVRYAAGALAGVLAIGGFIYWKYMVDVASYSSMFTVGALQNGFQFGLPFGLLIGLALLLAIEPASRLRAWSRPSRIALSVLLSGLVNAVVFVAYRAYYDNIPDPFDKADLVWYFGGVFIFMVGLAVTSGLTRRVWLRATAGALVMFAALYTVFSAQQAGLTQESLLTLVNRNGSLLQSAAWAIFVSFVLAFVSFLPEILTALRRGLRVNRSAGR